MTGTSINTLSLKAYLTFWFGALAVLFFGLWLFGDILLPFVVGIAVAYLLNPVVLRLTRRGLSRQIATIIILVLFLILMVVGLSVLIPLLVREMTMLADAMPDIALRLRTIIETQRDHLRPYIGDVALADVVGALTNNAGQTLNVGRGMLTGILNGGQAALSLVAFVALMPIVAFFMMVEWPNIVAAIDNLLPRKSAETIRDLFRELDRKISGFVRGQIVVCLMLAVYYAVGLVLVGVDYGALIGIVAGVLSIIPFIGSLTALAGSIIMGLVQVPADGWVVLVSALAVIAVGQFVEGNFVTPRIVGDAVGLHPLWIIFALLAGASLGGLLGMFVAVPVAAAVAVVVSFAIRQYKLSNYYLEGQSQKAAGAPNK